MIGIDDLDMPIYRIFGRKYFRKMLNDNRLTLVHPEMWDDPFENILMQSRLKKKNGTYVSLRTLRETLFGQCWTAESESDALWRVYSPDKGAIQVKTMVRKLFDAFWRSPNPLAQVSFFIGRVRYITEKELISLLTRPDGFQKWLHDPTGRGLAESLLFKRKAFAYEDEIRLIYRHPSIKPAISNVCQFPFLPNNVLEEAVLDPRLTDKEAERTKQEIFSWGFGKPIKKSTLYTPQHFDIKFVLPKPKTGKGRHTDDVQLSRASFWERVSRTQAMIHRRRQPSAGGTKRLRYCGRASG